MEVWNNKEYPYLYETHLHTNQASRCANNTGAEMAKACKEAGYSGIFVTDHNWASPSTVATNVDWEELVAGFAKGYRDAKEMGDKIGLDVFFAWEAAYGFTDLLVFGLSPEWLIGHPEIRYMSVEDHFKLIDGAGGIVIHAHPYRTAFYIPEVKLYPEYVHGVEIANGAHFNPKSGHHYNLDFDKSAEEYAKKHNFLITTGSDIHSTDLFHGGMGFKRKLSSSQDFVETIKSREDCVLINATNFESYLESCL